jgi:hypothetical protein
MSGFDVHKGFDMVITVFVNLYENIDASIKYRLEILGTSLKR